MTMTTVKQVVSVKPTDLRMNDAYIFYYNNLAKLIITGIVPFVALCVFNTKVKHPPQSLWYFPKCSAEPTKPCTKPSLSAKFISKSKRYAVIDAKHYVFIWAYKTPNIGKYQ